MFAPLSCGGAVILADNALELGELPARGEVRLVNTVPSAIAEMVRMRAVPEGVKVVNLAGEVLRRSLAEEVYEETSAGRVVNLYGPSEDTTYSTYEEVRRGSREEVSIGRPIANTRVYVLDERMEVVGVSVVGEIYIGGEGLARGYLGRAEMTGERFVPDPYGEKGGGRMYRTGDIGRYRAGGEIEYVGRKDQQVKVRGYRIELGEIEGVIGQHPCVAQSVVVAIDSPAGDKRIVAYMVCDGPRPSVSDLRSFIKIKLPDYMVPSAFIFLNEMPLTPNGKTDRGRLPRPDDFGGNMDRVILEPRTYVEEVLAAIWSNLLGVASVAINDSFFELGGHSLLATQVASRARSVFIIDLPLREVFEAVTLEELAACVESRLRQNRPAAQDPINRIARNAELPLSYAQQRLWLLNQIDSASCAYNMTGALRIRGNLNVEALRKSINEIIRRHESLRTIFSSTNGQPTQVIAEHCDINLTVVDLRELRDAEREDVAAAIARKEAQEPFDLRIGPLFRVNLLRLHNDQYELLVSMHHIISDGWSVGVFIKELQALYAVNTGEAQIDLPELIVQYADYAAWQREWLSTGVLESEMEYWKDRLDQLPQLELPTDHARPPAQTFNGATVSITIGDGLLGELKALGYKHHTSLFMTLLAGFNVLLYRHSGQRDIPVGTPIANRNHVEIERLIGFFVNTLVMRTDLSGDPTFAQLLERVRETALSAYAHQDAPFEKLVEELSTDRTLSRTPLFQVLFVLENAPTQQLTLNGLEAELVEVDNGTAKFDLTLTIKELPKGLEAVFQYNKDLYEEETISRMAHQFHHLLNSLVDSPHIDISVIDYIPPAQRSQIINDFNLTSRPYSPQLCIHHLFERQVELRPESLAVVYKHERLSYRQINDRANQLAHFLTRHGAGPESLVAVCLSRTPEMIVSLLAILKAGAAYVPLDPNYPSHRLSFMIEDTAASLIISEQDLADKLPDHNSRLVCVDADRQEVGGLSTLNPQSLVSADNLAYVIYTSGSTGRPKGVAIEHRSAAVLLQWACEVFDGEELSGVLASTSICFDLSVFEMFAPLSCGGAVILADNALELGELPARGEVRLVNTVPSAIAEMVRMRAVPEGVKVVNLAGEVLRRSLAEEVYEETSAGRVVNLYGPSEDTTYSTYEEVRRGSREEVSIGRPIANTRVYVLDERMEVVGVSVVGEIYIGGEGLARGYLGRAEMTGERFVPDPYGEKGGGRMYRTGDIGRYRAGGEIEYVGRKDQQVKVRGYRIELGEIEGVIGQHPCVAQSVVVAIDSPAGDKRIVAYMVCDGPRPSVSDLRSFIKIKLPDYMVPSAFIFLNEMPLTPNGKTDRGRLPRPDDFGGNMDRVILEPRTYVEEVLAAIWSNLLGVASVAINDSFFELGGHSLLATQVASRARSVFIIDLPLREVFEAVTLEELAACVESRLRQNRPAAQDPINRIARNAELPLSYAQQRLWLLNQIDSASCAYNMTGALRIRGNLNVEALRKSINEIIRRHESLRTIFSSTNGQPTQVIAEHCDINLTVVDLRELRDAEREDVAAAIARKEAQEPFDLRIGPLFRVNLLRLHNDQYELLVSMHHIISDGWSVGVFIKELQALYAVNTGEAQIDLPELIVQYADYAAWQREWLSTGVLESEMEYWKDRLDQLPQLELPTDHARPPAQTFNGATVSITIGDGLLGELKALGYKHHTSLFMTLLAGFNVLLYRHSGQRDIPVGTPIANRNHVEIERLIGFFVNTLVMRTDLSGDPTFAQLLERVRETALSAYAHQDAPFEKLVEELQPERDLGRAPLFQVMFNLLSFEDQRLELPGLTLEMMSVPDAASKFDLTLYAKEVGDQITLELVYNSDLFSSGRMTEMLSQFNQILVQIVEKPHEKISDYSLLTRKSQLLLPNPAQKIPAKWEGSIVEHFTKQAQRSPGLIAVTDKTGTWTYEELDARSNQLANSLLSAGIERQQVVAIYGGRDRSLVLALLGVLKAGAAFVILDPAYPTSRLINYLEQAKPRGLITCETSGAMPGQMQDLVTSLAFRCHLDTGNGDAFDGSSRKNPEIAVCPDDQAYIAFTSGSTGAAKGIVGIHRPLSHFIDWHTRMFKLDKSDRFSMLSGLSHDPLLRDVFTPLWAGASLHIPSQEDMNSSHHLSRWMQNEGITIAHLTPALSQLLTEAAVLDANHSGAALSSLRCVFYGGDVLKASDISRLRAMGATATCVNFYGATETPQAMGYRVVPRQKGGADQNQSGRLKDVLPVGKGIDGVQLLVINKAEHLAGVGELGEICVRTPYLTIGYLGNDQLTRERFISNPFTGDSNDKVYRTGDLGRYLPDGNVEFAGRRDRQVKIRGFRVELSEIESAICEHPAVTESLIDARVNGSGEWQLVGYIIAQQELTEEDLRKHLKGRVPEYMIPAAFVPLDHLPLTPNGKIDRSGLPLPSFSSHQSDFVAPRNALEQSLASLWSQLLPAQLISVNDNFFDLGGHSLLAARLVARIEMLLGVSVGLKEVFDSPTLAEMADAIRNELSGSRFGQPPPIRRVSRDSELALSFSQQRLWFLHQLEPLTTAYNMPVGMRLSGRVEVSALEQTFNRIIERHETLRTSFSSEAGMPRQEIHPELKLRLEVEDVSRMSEAERKQYVEGVVREEANRRFDLSRVPLVRVRVVRESRQEHVLVVNIHHIISDGWSLGVLAREMGEIYAAVGEGREAAVEELKVQYVDYAEWQREYMSGERLEREVGYWKEQLGGAAPVLELPTDRPRPALQSFRGASRSFTLAKQLSGGLKAMSLAHGTTLFMSLLAAFNVLLQRYSGQDDILVGTPVANRNHVEIERLIGFFVNTLVIRTEVTDNLRFCDLLSRVRESSLGAFAHQGLPFDRLVEEIQPARSLSHTPIFQVMFSLQNASPNALKLAEVDLTFLDIERDDAKFDITLSMIEDDRGLGGKLEYNTELFEQNTIDRMLAHFQNLLAGAVANPHQLISELPLLTQEEMSQLLVDWNQSRADYPNLTIHQLFEQQAQLTPCATAVIFGEEHLSYKQLDERATLLCDYLSSRGAGPGALVGICLQRGLQMMTGLLAILKSGAAYVPIDPAYPRQRISYIIEDAAPKIILTEQELVQLLPDCNAELVCVDGEWPTRASQQTNDNALQGGPKAGPDDLAYVIFTSGSTGRPKGVQVTHRNVVNFLTSIRREPGLTDQDTLLAVTTLSFDIAGLELFLPLSVGARVVIASREEATDALRLPEMVTRYGVTVMQATPATWKMMLKGGWKGSKGLKVLCGGEAFPRDLADELIEKTRSVWNMYGPTETTIWSSIQEVHGGSGAVSVGRPIANTQTYVLDKKMRPVPVGVAGELYIGGEGVSAGYRNRADLTAEKFVPDPFNNSLSQRLYQTGDLVKRLPDGGIEFLGRIDHQVKIRGFRIELGEVEAVLMQHSKLTEAVVVDRKDATGESRLVAYVVEESAQENLAAELRSYLKQHLPEYMVPAAYVVMSEMPLTANGKIDRRRLPEPETLRQEGGADYVKPKSDTEKIIAAIWQEVLNADSLSIHDNFFDLGGHSLLLVEVNSKLREALNREIQIVEMFKHPTVMALAKYLDEGQQNTARTKRTQDRASKRINAMNRHTAAAEMGEVSGD
jgi:amino acid adenylation domain-containing protein